MHSDISADEAGHTAVVSTGSLPDPHEVELLLHEAFELYRTVTDGTVADYIPALAAAAPELFGLCVAGVNGALFTAGDSDVSFSIQSVSKPFVFALIVEALGFDDARLKLGVNNTGLPFNSVMAIELNEDRTMNAMVNAGAIAATSLVPGDTADDKWAFIREGLSRFAGRALDIDQKVYLSEAATNQRNQGIARLLESYDRMYFDPLAATDVYTKQCSLLVTVAIWP